MKKLFLVLFLFAAPFLSAKSIYSVYLMNDSSFPLTAIVQAADGSYMGQQIIPPGDQNQTLTDKSRIDLSSPSSPKRSLTPFTVIWKCSYEGYYSVCTGIMPGAVVKASSGAGSKMCKPRPIKGQQQEE